MALFDENFKQNMDSFGAQAFAFSKEISDRVSQKAQRYFSWTKLNFDLQKEQSELNRCFAQLGKLCYAELETYHESDDKMSEGKSRNQLLDEIRQHLSHIELLKQQIREQRNQTVPPTATFSSEGSSENGAPGKKDGTSVPKLMYFCPSCHCGNLPDAKKCLYCGFNFTQGGSL